MREAGSRVRARGEDQIIFGRSDEGIRRMRACVEEYKGASCVPLEEITNVRIS